MEEYEKSSEQITSETNQDISKFTGKTNQNEPLRYYRGGGMGGLTPYEPLPDCIPPQRGVPWALATSANDSANSLLRNSRDSIPLGCHGNQTQGAALLGGGEYTREIGNKRLPLYDFHRFL